MAVPTPVISIDTRQILQQMSGEISGELGQKLDVWAREYNRNWSRRIGVSEMHGRLAYGARQAMLTAYRNSGIGKRPSYRGSDEGKLKRYSNGAMEDAIANGGVVATKEGIQLIDTGTMDKYARQWYRLNFGTFAAPKPPKTESIKFRQRSTRRKFSLEDYGPSISGGFRIPYGFFSPDFKSKSSGRIKAVKPGPPGQHAFYVLNRDIQVSGVRQKPFFSRQTAHIHGKRFLDAGAVYLNDHYGKELTELTKEWEQAAKNKLK